MNATSLPFNLTLSELDSYLSTHDEYVFALVGAEGDYLNESFKIVSGSFSKLGLKVRNPSFHSLFRVDNNFLKVKDYYDYDCLKRDLNKLIAGKDTSFYFETPFLEGSKRFILSLSVNYFPDKKCFFLSIKRLHDLEKYFDEFIFNADHDPTTGLLNKRLCLDHINAVNLHSDDTYVGFMDLNNFKLINDFYGHMEGDLMLKSFASCLVKNATPNLTLFRFGGDEFILIAKKTTKKELSEYLKKVALSLKDDTSNIAISFSAGLVKVSSYMKNPLFLIRCSDKAMYICKKRKLDYYFLSETMMKKIVDQEDNSTF